MNIFIVEDEHKTAVLLKNIIEAHPTYKVVNICDSIEAAVAYLEGHQHDLDLVFMDIQLSDGHSFEIFDKMTVNLPIIFCTSYDEYALKAFKNNGIDYILKPFHKEDIYQALLKVEQLKDRFANKTGNRTNIKDLIAKEKTYQTSFIIRFREKVYPVLVADIAFVYLKEGTVYLCDFGGNKHPVFKTLEEIENELLPRQFYRVNRQIIINRQAFKNVEASLTRKMIVHLSVRPPEQVFLPRSKVKEFLTWIKNNLPPQYFTA